MKSDIMDGNNHSPFRVYPAMMIIDNKRIFRMPPNEEFVIRTNRERMLRWYDDRTSAINDTVDEYAELRRDYEELCSFGIKIPEYMFVLAHDIAYYGPNREDNYDDIIAVMKNVRGRRLHNFPENRLNPEIISEAEKAFIGIVDYFDHKLESGGRCLTDLHYQQFMCGRTDPDSLDRLYFIDIERRVWYIDIEEQTHEFFFSKNPEHEPEKLEECTRKMFNMSKANLYFLKKKTGMEFPELEEKVIKFQEKYID